jgi:cold shock CspA family protein
MQMSGLRGTITEIHRRQQRGTIQGEDGRMHHFDREGMIRWLEFDELSPGDHVRFDVETTGSAFNVERG